MEEREVVAQFTQLFTEPEPQEEETLEAAADVEEEVIEDEEVVEADEIEAEAAEDEDSTDESEEEPETYTVRVNGEELKVPLPELIAGYSRHADYTRKTQALSERDKALAAELENARQERAQYAAALPHLQQVIEGSVGPEPDPTQFTDRNEYLWAKDQWTKAMQQREAVVSERQRVMAMQQQEQQEQLERWSAQQAEELARKLPEWENADLRAKETRAIADYGLQLGFTEDELGNVRDHRFVMVLRDAMRFRELQSTGRKKAKAAKTKTVAPGTGQSGMPTRQLQKQRERARQTGKVEDIAPLMAQLLAG